MRKTIASTGGAVAAAVVKSSRGINSTPSKPRAPKPIINRTPTTASKRKRNAADDDGDDDDEANRITSISRHDTNGPRSSPTPATNSAVRPVAGGGHTRAPSAATIVHTRETSSSSSSHAARASAAAPNGEPSSSSSSAASRPYIPFGDQQQPRASRPRNDFAASFAARTPVSMEPTTAAAVMAGGMGRLSVSPDHARRRTTTAMTPGRRSVSRAVIKLEDSDVSDDDDALRGFGDGDSEAGMWAEEV